MCPIHKDSEISEYRPTKVHNIIATFEQLSLSAKQNPLVRSESAVSCRTKSVRKSPHKIRDVKSDVIQNNNCENFILDNIDGANKTSYNCNHLEKIDEADISETKCKLENLNEIRTKAQGALKTYDNEVIRDWDKTAPSYTYISDVYLGNKCADLSELSDNSEDIRSRNSSVSIEDEYVSLKDVSHSEEDYCVLRISSSDACRYVPTYENISILREIAATKTISPRNVLVSTSSVILTNNNGTNSKDERTSKDKKKYVIDELINTEERYIKDLEFVIKNYMQYLSEIYTGCPMRRYKYIFINIEMICTESKKLLDDIVSNDYNYDAIGKLFCQNKHLMERYTIYCKNKKVSEDLIKGDYFEVIENRRREIRDPLGLGSYLLKPIQRLLRYEMFLRKLYKYVTKDGGGGTWIMEAINLIHRTARKGNDLIIISCIEDMPHCILDTGDFIMADTFKMLTPKKMEIELFLFKNMIVFATKKEVDSFVYKTYIPVENLTKSSDSHKTTITLEDYFMKKNHKDPSYILDAMNMNKKKKWLAYIEKILWSQLNDIKERAKNRYI